MERRDANTAHVVTLTGVSDPAQGREDHTLHRDPVAALAAVLDTSDQATARSAVATATESAEHAGSTRTAAELLADAAQLAATERTTTWLDQLADTGVITGAQRARIAAEDGAASLTRVLRRAELAGHDPRRVLNDAVADRPLDGSRNLTNVIYSRIRDEHRFNPIGESFADWTPRVDNPEWTTYLTALATAADQRAEELGEQAAAERPAWAVDAFGPVPDLANEREVWQQKAGIVAAYRELRGHDDYAEALGPAPKAGEVEAHAAFRVAWRTLGRPEVDRDEYEMSDGQLRMRVRSYQRELAFAPRYVANELAGTHQAAATHRQTAALRTAEADALTDPDERTRLLGEARDAAALAEVLDGRAAELQKVDDARAMFLAHSAHGRVEAERAQLMLTERHVDDAEPEQLVTAEEWLLEHRAAVVEDERHRIVTESDVDETPVEALDDPEHLADRDDQLEVPERDVREVAAEEPAPVAEDAVRVPSAAETAASTAQADRAIAVITARNLADAQEEAEHRAAELDRWHTDDQTAEHEMSDGDGRGLDEFNSDEPVDYDPATVG